MKTVCQRAVAYGYIGSMETVDRQSYLPTSKSTRLECNDRESLVNVIKML